MSGNAALYWQNCRYARGYRANMPIPKWDLDGVFFEGLSDFDRQVGESYRHVWSAIAKETPKGRLQAELPLGFLDTHDRQVEFPPATEEHSLAAQRFVAFARGQLRRRGFLGQSSDELRVLTVMRQMRVWNVIAPHFGSSPSDWSKPYIDIERGMQWVDEARNRNLPNSLFRWRVRNYQGYVNTLSDLNVLNYTMALWLLSSKAEFTKEVCARGYLQKLLVADVGRMDRPYPAIGVAKREPYWEDLKEGFRIAVVNRAIPVSYDGTKIETLEEAIEAKQRLGIPLTDTDKRYLQSMNATDDERRESVLRGIARWKSARSSTPSNTA
jgi:hypothetical protein